jgi:IBR domain, a half RING-finger domain
MEAILRACFWRRGLRSKTSAPTQPPPPPANGLHSVAETGVANVTQASPPPNTPIPLCTICDLNEIPHNTKRITKDCKHKCTTCDICMQHHITEEVNSKGNTTVIKCLGAGCKAVLDYEDVHRFASKETFAMYDKLVLRRALEKMKDFRWCGHAGCGCGQIHANPSYPKMTCHACRKITCFRHQCPWHENRTCDQYERDSQKSEEVALLQYIQSNKVMRCPKCKHGIEKNQGCDHMTCKKPYGCGAEFCYRCGADYNGENGIAKKGNRAHARTCTYYA